MEKNKFEFEKLSEKISICVSREHVASALAESHILVTGLSAGEFFGV